MKKARITLRSSWPLKEPTKSAESTAPTRPSSSQGSRCRNRRPTDSTLAWRAAARRLRSPELPFLRPVGRLTPWIPRLVGLRVQGVDPHLGEVELGHARLGELPTEAQWERAARGGLQRAEMTSSPYSALSLNARVSARRMTAVSGGWSNA